jgi:Tfp pilus assembly protein PilZ
MFERASTRVNPRTPVRVEIGKPGQPTALGVVSNISDHGACVVTDGDFPIGESLVLHLVFSPETQPFQAAGRVIWIRPAGEAPGAQRYGLQWAHRTGPQHARLRELISGEL